jgi:hypothetical protein
VGTEEGPAKICHLQWPARSNNKIFLCKFLDTQEDEYKELQKGGRGVGGSVALKFIGMQNNESDSLPDALGID